MTGAKSGVKIENPHRSLKGLKIPLLLSDTPNTSPDPLSITPPVPGIQIVLQYPRSVFYVTPRGVDQHAKE
jgi:hypothetical protein